MNEKEKRLVKMSTEKAYQTGSQCCQSLSIVLNYQTNSSGIQFFYDMVGKSQVFQHFVYVEVNSTFSTA